MARVYMTGAGGGTDFDVVTTTAADVLLNKVFLNNEGEEDKGTMPNIGAVSQTLGAGGSYTIPKGYHNGSGKVSVKSLAEICASATLDSNARMLSGYKAYGKNGTLYTGNIASMAGGSYTASNTKQTIECSGKYMTSNITIAATNVQSIISFSFASRNYSTANFKWQNPSKGPYYGIVVRGKQGNYPTSVTDGSSIYSGYGSNQSASGTSYSGYKNVGTGKWYFTAYSYYILDGKNIYDSGKQTNATFNCYECNETIYCDECDECIQYQECSNCHKNVVEGDCDQGPNTCGECPSYCYVCEECNERWMVDEGCNKCSSNDKCNQSYPEACNGNT